MLDLMCVHRYRVIYRLVNTVYVLGITSADLDDVDSNIFACACMVNQAVRSLSVLPSHSVFLVDLRGNLCPSLNITAIFQRIKNFHDNEMNVTLPKGWGLGFTVWWWQPAKVLTLLLTSLAVSTRR